MKLLGPALAALEDQKQHTFMKPHGRVFENPNTLEPWNGDKCIRDGHWRTALKKAKVRYRTPYQMRHTYASMMLSADEPLAWVSHQIGHSDVTITARVYATYIKDSRPDAGSKAEQLFAGKNAGIKAVIS